MVFKYKQVHFVERMLDSYVLFAWNCHNIALIGSMLVDLCFIMYIFYCRGPN
jgi:hypothetical protein